MQAEYHLYGKTALRVTPDAWLDQFNLRRVQMRQIVNNAVMLKRLPENHACSL